MTSGLISLPAPAPVTHPTPDETTLAGGGFWPDIDLNAFRAEMRVDETITLPRVRGAVVAGFLTAAKDLLPDRIKLVAAGATSLADAEGDDLDGEKVRVILFRRAVYAFAKAELCETYRDWDLSRKADDKAEQLELTADDYKRNARNALSDFRGDSRTIVELI